MKKEDQHETFETLKTILQADSELVQSLPEGIVKEEVKHVRELASQNGLEAIV